MANIKYGKCLICLEEKKLKRSHLISDYALNQMSEGIVGIGLYDPIENKDSFTSLTNEDFTMYAFCGECENKMSKYENIIKRAFFSFTPAPATFRIKNSTSDGYLLYGIEANDLHNAIEAHLYRISILGEKNGLNSPDYKNYYIQIGSVRTKIKLVLQRLNRNIASDIRKLINMSAKTFSIKVLGIYQIYQDVFESRLQEKMFLQKRMFLNRINIKEHKPIWVIVFLNMLFIVEENIKGAKYGNDSLNYNPINYDNNIINVKVIPMTEITKIILNRDSKLPVKNSYYDITSLINTSNTCIFCYRNNNHNSTDCCSELILENKIYFVIAKENGKYYLNPIRREHIDSGFKNKALPNLKITMYLNKNTSYRGILFGKNPTIKLDKSIESLSYIEQLKHELSRAKTLSA